MNYWGTRPSVSTPYMITITIAYTVSGEARGFKVGGLKGRVREGVYPLPLGPGELCPRKNFQITDAHR
jgi:hypothetical protein